jgi:hypothetical protein
MCACVYICMSLSLSLSLSLSIYIYIYINLAKVSEFFKCLVVIYETMERKVKIVRNTMPWDTVLHIIGPPNSYVYKFFCYSRSGKLLPTGKSGLLPIFVWPMNQECFFYIFKWFSKITAFCDTWKLYEIQISMPMNKVLLEYSQVPSFTYGLWLLLHYKAWTESLCQGPYVVHKA